MDKEKFFKLISGVVATIFFITSSISTSPLRPATASISTLRPSSEAIKGTSELVERLKGSVEETGVKAAAIDLFAPVMMSELAGSGFINDPRAILERELRPDGTLYFLGVKDGSVLIVGDRIEIRATGDNVEIKNVGHNLILTKSLPSTYEPSKGTYTYTGFVTKGEHPKDASGQDVKGDFEDRCSAPKLAVNFARTILQEYGPRSHNIKDKIESQLIKDKELFSDLAQVMKSVVDRMRILEMLVREEGLSEAQERLKPRIAELIIKSVAEAALDGDEMARVLIKEAGREIGQALAAFIAAYKDKEFAKHIVLASGISESFEKGIVDLSGKDLYLESIRTAAREELKLNFGIRPEKAEELTSGIIRSKLRYIHLTSDSSVVPGVKASSAGYEKETAEQIAHLCKVLMPERKTSERGYIFVEYIINSLDIPKLINEIAKASGRNYAVVKRQLSEYPMLKEIIDKYGTKQYVSIYTAPESPGLELMVLIGRIAVQHGIEVPTMARIFFSCVKPIEFINRLMSLEELQSMQIPELVTKLLGYPILDGIWSNYLKAIGIGDSASGSKASSAGTFTVDIEGVRYTISSNASDYQAIPSATQMDLKNMLAFLEKDEVSKASYQEIPGLIFKKLEECHSLSQIFINPCGLVLGEHRVYGFKDAGPDRERRIYIIFPNQPRPELEKVKPAAEWFAGKVGILVSKELIAKPSSAGKTVRIGDFVFEVWDISVEALVNNGLRYDIVSANFPFDGFKKLRKELRAVGDMSLSEDLIRNLFEGRGIKVTACFRMPGPYEAYLVFLEAQLKGFADAPLLITLKGRHDAEAYVAHLTQELMERLKAALPHNKAAQEALQRRRTMLAEQESTKASSPGKLAVAGYEFNAPDKIFADLGNKNPQVRREAVEAFKALYPELAADMDAYLNSLPLLGKMILDAAKSLGERHLYPFNVVVEATEEEMAKAAAGDVFEEVMQKLQANNGRGKDYVVMDFAAAPSQSRFLEKFVGLLKEAGRREHSDENYYAQRIIGVHLDEYVGLEDGHPAQFKTFLKGHLVDKLKFKEFHFLSDYGDEEEYIGLIKKYGGIDITCCGIGENGHIAFNDPPADFISEGIKKVKLDRICRIQQSRDYPHIYNPENLQLYDESGKEIKENMDKVLGNVPEYARSMTAITMLKAKSVFVIVPRKAKQEAIKTFFEYDLTPNVPATFLKTHPDMRLYLDEDSAELVSDEQMEKVMKFEGDIALGRPVPAPNIDNGPLSALHIPAIMRALKDMNAVAMPEVGPGARLTYPADTPTLTQYCAQEALRIFLETGYIPLYTVHGDHGQITKMKVDEYHQASDEVKQKALEELLQRQSDELTEGFLSIAIDTSTLTLLKEKDVRKRLKYVIDTAVKALKALQEKAKELGVEVSIEVEVGDIGKEISTVEEAVALIEGLTEKISELAEGRLLIDLIALQLGTSHGYDIDDNDRLVPYTGVTIDLKRAREVVDAFKKTGLSIRVALHGFSGTPVEFAPMFLDKGIGKVNINTDWQAICWKVIRAWYPGLYREIFNQAYNLAVAAKLKAQKNMEKALQGTDQAKIEKAQKAVDDISSIVTAKGLDDGDFERDRNIDFEKAKNRVIFGKKGAPGIRNFFRDPEKGQPFLMKIVQTLVEGDEEERRIGKRRLKSLVEKTEAELYEDYLNLIIDVQDNPNGINALDALDKFTYERMKELLEALGLKDSANKVAEIDRAAVLRLQEWQLKELRQKVAKLIVKSASAEPSNVVEVEMYDVTPPIPIITTPAAYAELIKMGLGDKLRTLVSIFNKELKGVTALDAPEHWIPLKELKKDTIEQIYFIGYKTAVGSLPASRVYVVKTKSGIELVVSPDSEIPQLAEVPVLEAVALCDAKAGLIAAAKSASAGKAMMELNRGLRDTENILLGALIRETAQAPGEAELLNDSLLTSSLKALTELNTKATRLKGERAITADEEELIQLKIKAQRSVIDFAKICAPIARIESEGTIIVDPSVIPDERQRAAVVSMLKDNKLRSALEYALSFKDKGQITKKTQIVLLEDASRISLDREKAILISDGQKLEDIKLFKVGVAKDKEDMLLPMAELIAIARGLLSLNNENFNQLFPAIKKMYEQYTGGNAIDAEIERKLREGTWSIFELIITTLPGVEKLNQQEIERLQRQALAALIAA